MDRIITLLLWVLLIANAVALIVTLIDLWPDNPLKEYSFLLGISFITLGGLARQVNKRKSESQLKH
ncbi:hypothetical protein SB49_00255 [Sediminicola sp. YIK13]|uniref:hypothetical protein n=1 Tax=Sediminicola sp. YIK13 TaxID=1453352 RepID=UPI00071FB515|nr:hypothetical protein [Sediminicola sp. YIK13]ALM06416.1 hypothetical protein SB49_00255 [Sediminicola sp. YIK13]